MSPISNIQFTTLERTMLKGAIKPKTRSFRVFSLLAYVLLLSAAASFGYLALQKGSEVARVWCIFFVFVVIYLKLLTVYQELTRKLYDAISREIGSGS